MRLGVRGRLLCWIRGFLTSRSGRVKYADCMSSTRSYDYGLPQGSAISPVLFNIFVSDLFDEFDFSSEVGADAEISVFADDIRASVYCSDPAQACSILSSILLRVSRWASRKRITFSLSKRAFTIFSRVRVSDELHVSLGNFQLKLDPNPKYLGVWWDSTLSFSFHASKVRAKAWRALNFVRHLAGRDWGASFSTMKRHSVLP